MPNFYKAKSEEFVDKIFEIDILSKINLENKEEERINIKINDFDWIIRKSYFPSRLGDKDFFEIGIACNNYDTLQSQYTNKKTFFKNLVRKHCCCYLEGTYFDKNSKGNIINKKTITRNGFHFGHFVWT